jgi:hypothetical protein
MTLSDPVVTLFVEATKNHHDADGLARLFGPDSVVIDDNTEYRGAKQIARWIQEHQIAPKITLTVIDFDPMIPVTANADGDFPGGPLPFRFQLPCATASISSR